MKGVRTMAEKKKSKPAEAAKEPGFFSDHGYGSGTAITLHNPPQKPKDSKAVKSAKTAKNKRK